MRTIIIIFSCIILVSGFVIYGYNQFKNIDVKYGSESSSSSPKESKSHGLFVKDLKIINYQPSMKIIKDIWIEKRWKKINGNNISVKDGLQLVVSFLNEKIYHKYLVDFKIKMNDKTFSGIDGNAVIRFTPDSLMNDTIIILVDKKFNNDDTLMCVGR